MGRAGVTEKRVLEHVVVALAVGTGMGGVLVGAVVDKFPLGFVSACLENTLEKLAVVEELPSPVDCEKNCFRFSMRLNEFFAGS